MPALTRPVFSHSGIRVWDIAAMRRFYMTALDLLVSDEGVGPTTGLTFVFLTADPLKHHQFVLVEGRPRDEKSTTAFQMSFKLPALADLRHYTAKAEAAGASRFHPLSHGNAWSVYFDDPEGNTIELYVDTPWYVPQPFGDPLDLTCSDEAILRATEARCRAVAGFQLATEWQDAIRRRLSTPSTPQKETP